jgi:nitrate/nitrite transport system ATP-binding protein
VNSVTPVETHSPTAQLSIRNVTKVFWGKKDLFSKLSGKKSRDFIAIENIDLDIEPNTFVSIIGPSGCGKSTLLNMIAGLSEVTAGKFCLTTIPFRGRGPIAAWCFKTMP